MLRSENASFETGTTWALDMLNNADRKALLWSVLQTCYAHLEQDCIARYSINQWGRHIIDVERGMRIISDTAAITMICGITWFVLYFTGFSRAWYAFSLLPFIDPYLKIRWFLACDSHLVRGHLRRICVVKARIY